jgi:uncharacterized membrane protein
MKQEMTGKRYGYIFLLLLILTVASALRFYGLSLQSLENDEIAAIIINTRDTFKQTLVDWLINDLNPPLYSALHFVVIRLFGNAEWVVRLPSAIAGLLSIGGLYALGHLLFSRKEGLVAAAIATVLWIHMYYSQQARSYALLLACCSWMLYFWFRYLRAIDGNDRGSRINSYCLSLCLLVMALLHYYGMALAGLVGLVTLIRGIVGRKPIKRLLVPFIPTALLIILFIYKLFLPSPWFSQWLTAPSLVQVALVFPWFFNGSAAIAILSVVFSLYALFVRSEKKKGLSKLLRAIEPVSLLACLIVVPLIMTFAFSHLVKPLFQQRYLLIVLPPLIILTARGLIVLLRKESLQVMAIVLILILGTGDLIFRTQYYTKPNRDQFREAAQLVTDHWNLYPGVIITCTWNTGYYDYYFKRLGFEHRVAALAAEAEDVEMILDHMADRQVQYLWFLTGSRNPDPDLIGNLNDRFLLHLQKEFIGTEVRLYGMGEFVAGSDGLHKYSVHKPDSRLAVSPSE